MRGKEKVLGEVSISFMAYNLGRAVEVLDFSGFLAYLRAYRYQKMDSLLLWCLMRAQKATKFFHPVVHCETW
jgi:hypothetical protein